MDDQLSTFLKDFFQNDSLVLTDETNFQDVPGWDSLAHVNLINALATEFEVKFSVREMMRMNSVGAIRTVLAAKSRT